MVGDQGVLFGPKGTLMLIDDFVRYGTAVESIRS